MLTQFATAKAGLILVNINPAYRPHELEYALNKVGCQCADPGALASSRSDYIGMMRELAPELDRGKPGKLDAAQAANAAPPSSAMGADTHAGHAEFRRYRRSGHAGRTFAELERLAGELQFDDPINIQFTSGTTGNPKGATLTHHNILNNGFFIGEAMRLTDQDRLCIPVPLYHCFGMVLGNLACVTHGPAWSSRAKASTRWPF